MRAERNPTAVVCLCAAAVIVVATASVINCINEGTINYCLGYAPSAVALTRPLPWRSLKSSSIPPLLSDADAVHVYASRALVYVRQISAACIRDKRGDCSRSVY